MRIKNDSRILFATATTSRRPPAPELVCIAKGKFDLQQNDTMTLVEGLRELAQGPFQHDVYADDDDERAGALLTPSDFAEFKPHGEVMLTGSCQSPRGRSVQELGVRLRVGRLHRALLVRGDRSDGRAEPKPFVSMPLDHAHAYGGEGFSPNPVGKGHGGDALPNVVEPDDASEPPRPACFAPINPSWPQRAGRVGSKYDERYFEERFPFYPEDFDWRYFQAAPPAQWLEGFWRGDEQVVLEHLHPAHPRFETKLPGLRVRVFVKDDRGDVREAKMVLDTIVINTDASTAVLTWRGHTSIRKALATDVRTVLVAQEALTDRPRSDDEYHAQLEAFEQDPLELDQRMPDDLKAQQALLEAEPDAARGETEQGKRLGAMLQERLGAVAEDPQRKVIAAVEDAMRREPEAATQIDATLTALEGGDDESDAIPPYVAMSPHAKPRVYLRSGILDARARLADARARLTQALAHAGPSQRAEAEIQLETLAEQEKQLYDPQLAKLDPTLREVSQDDPGPGADLRGQDLSRRDLRGVDLRGACLDGAILTRANLRGCDLTGASLQGTVLFRADFTDAVLRECNLDQLNAAEAVLEGADLSDATVHEAYFKGARLARARMDRVRGHYVGFPESDLTELSMTEAELSDADFRQARLESANLRGTLLHKALFLEAKAERVCLDGAKLDHANFIQADLSHASMVGTTGERTSFLKATLASAKLSRAILVDAFFDDAKAPDTQFAEADLRRARFLRADLDRARFDRANVMQADFSDAEVDGASFRGANLYDAKLLRTGGRGVDMTGAELTLTRTKEGV